MSLAIRRPHPCEHCAKSFSSSHQLSQHLRIHTGEKPYKCSYCDKRFKQLSHVQQHTRLHTGERPYKCSFADCGRAFIQLSNLQQHMRNHCSADKADKFSEKQYLCNLCGKSFKAEGSLITHQSKKHPEFSQSGSYSLTQLNALTKSYYCNDVHSKFMEDSFLKTKRSVTGPYACNICHQSYLNEGSLNKHLKTHPETSTSVTTIPYTRFWPCNVCSSVFTTEAALLNHMERMRTDAKHQFEAQIILSCAAAEKRQKEAHSHSALMSAAMSSLQSILPPRLSDGNHHEQNNRSEMLH